MARWTVAEAVTALESRDKDAREDLGRTCPLFVTATYSELLRAVDLMTARQVEVRLRQMLEDAEETVDEPKKKRKRKTEVVKELPELEEDNSPVLSEEEEDLLDDIFDDD